MSCRLTCSFFVCIHRSVTLGELHDNDRLQGPWTRIQLENESNRKPMRSQISPARTYVYMCIFTVHSWLVRSVLFLPLSCFRGTVLMIDIYMIYIYDIYICTYVLYINIYICTASLHHSDCWMGSAAASTDSFSCPNRYQHLSYQIFSKPMAPRFIRRPMAPKSWRVLVAIGGCRIGRRTTMIGFFRLFGSGSSVIVIVIAYNIL